MSVKGELTFDSDPEQLVIRQRAAEKADRRSEAASTHWTKLSPADLACSLAVPSPPRRRHEDALACRAEWELKVGIQHQVAKLEWIVLRKRQGGAFGSGMHVRRRFTFNQCHKDLADRVR